jgi:hypothetical protein
MYEQLLSREIINYYKMDMHKLITFLFMSKAPELKGTCNLFCISLADCTRKSSYSKLYRYNRESVVVRKKASDVKNNPSKQSWSLGILPPSGPVQPHGSRGRGGMRGRRGGRRGRFWRGSRVRGQWAPRGMF